MGHLSVGNDLGPGLPPDEINVIPTAGADYGWPYCYGNRTVQPPLGSPERCAGTVPSLLDLPAHVAPLGLAFAAGTGFPPELRGDLFLALHGSALLDDPIGYSLVRVPIRDGKPQAPEEFVRGWLVGDVGLGPPDDAAGGPGRQPVPDGRQDGCDLPNPSG